MDFLSSTLSQKLDDNNLGNDDNGNDNEIYEWRWLCDESWWYIGGDSLDNDITEDDRVTLENMDN